MPTITPDEIIEQLGGGSIKAAAARLCVSRQSIWAWQQAGEVPELWAYKAESLLGDAYVRTSKPKQRKKP